MHAAFEVKRSYNGRKRPSVDSQRDMTVHLQALIFCNNPATAPALAARLNALGIPAAYVSARLPQTTRLDAVAALRSLRLRAAVTSDVLARGIDLEFINLVVNFDLPHDQDTYAHRLGRAGRFGSSALAVTLVSATEVGVAEEFAKSAGCSTFPLCMLQEIVPKNIEFLYL